LVFVERERGLIGLGKNLILMGLGFVLHL
jgi:hypothetical protein